MAVAFASSFVGEGVAGVDSFWKAPHNFGVGDVAVSRLVFVCLVNIFNFSHSFFNVI